MKFRFILLIFFLTVISGTAVGAYLGVVRGTPSIEELKRGPSAGSMVYADDDTVLTELSAQKSIHVPLRRIPEYLINAVVAVEDSRFFKHKGLDYIALVRAALKDIYFRELKQGGSTITQQLAKITFLSPEKTLKRKLREAALAIKIEKNLSKDEILELYLNRVYFGHGAYGVEMASRLYFGKSVTQLSLPEAALIAGLVRAPSTYSPFINARKAKERQTIVLQRMREEGYISPEEYEKYVKKPLKLSARRPPSESYEYFIDCVKRELEKKYPPEKIYSGQLKIYTTIQKDLQVQAQDALREGLRELDKRRGWRGPLRHVRNFREKGDDAPLAMQPASHDISEAVVLDVQAGRATLDVAGRTGTLLEEDARWAQKVINPKTGKARLLQDFNLKKVLSPGDVVLVRVKSSSGKTLSLSLEQEPLVEGSLIAMDPKTGFVRAVIGGYDHRQSEFNRAINAKRQPGSSFKPVIYGAAIDSGAYTPASLMDDEPITFAWSGGSWSPQNYDGEYWGMTSLRTCLAYSRNIPTVKLLDKLGVEKAIEFGRRLGITAQMPRNLSLALGSITLTPEELVSAYAPFANGGVKITPTVIKYITDAQGRILESDEPPGEKVISADTAYTMTTMLEDVVKYGTGWRAKAVGVPVAGKTGTTNDFKDAWFIGYSANLLAGVWVGFDDMTPLGSGETGARAASPIWTSFMKYAATRYPPGDFEYVSDGENLKWDPQTGRLVNSPEGTGAPIWKGPEPQDAEPTPPFRPEGADYD